MTRLTPALLMHGGFEKVGICYEWRADSELCLSVKSESGVDWGVFPFGEYDAQWPRMVRYWEELKPILAATQVGYDME